MSSSHGSKSLWKSKSCFNGDNFMMDSSDDDDENMFFPLHGLDVLGGGGGVPRSNKRKKKFRSCGFTFTRVVKGVFSHAAKKTRSKKIEEWSSLPKSSRSLSSKIKKTFKFKKKESNSQAASSSDTSPSDGSFVHSSSTCSSLFSSSPGISSSSSSSSLSNSPSESERKPSSRSQSQRNMLNLIDLNMIMPMNPVIINRKKPCKKKCGEQNEDYIGLYFILLICLMGLVFSGKALAIFCTATSLFSITRRRGRLPDQGLTCTRRGLELMILI